MTKLMSFLVVSLFALPVLAESPGKEALTQELMKKSGAEQQIRQLPLQAFAGLEDQKGKLSAGQYKNLRRILGAAFHADTLEKSVSKRVLSDLDHETMRKALTWLRSDLGTKITRLEEAASSPKAVKLVQAFAKRLQTAPPPPQRVALARQIDRATGSSELALMITEATALQVATAFDATLPTERQMGVDRLRIQLERERPKLREGSRQAVMVNLLYAYESLSDRELQRYLEFLETQEGRDYMNVMSAALMDGILEGIETLSRALPDAIKQSDGKKAA